MRACDYISLIKLDDTLHYDYHEDNTKFEKVIFLDIDGVLNDDLMGYGEDKTSADVNKVNRLKRIVDETGAEIVLTSSWRYTLYNYLIAETDSEEERIKLLRNDEKVIHLIKTLADAGIRLREFTEEVGSGPLARPAEIRAWLLDKVNVKSFVILDDDDFWEWGWLKSHVVLTIDKNRMVEHDYARGLLDEHADRAIEILNETN